MLKFTTKITVCPSLQQKVDMMREETFIYPSRHSFIRHLLSHLYVTATVLDAEVKKLLKSSLGHLSSQNYLH